MNLFGWAISKSRFLPFNKIYVNRLNTFKFRFLAKDKKTNEICRRDNYLNGYYRRHFIPSYSDK